MSKLASLAKQRSKRTAGAGLDTTDSSFSSINLLDRLQKKASPSESPKPRERTIPKLFSKPAASTASLSSPKPSSKQLATVPKPVAIQDLFPEIDYSDPYSGSAAAEGGGTTEATRFLERRFAVAEQVKPANYVYSPAIQHEIYRAFSTPSPDDVVLAAQADAFRQEEAAAHSASVQRGLARMQLGTTPDQFSNARNNLNFYIIGK
jgi:phospholipase C